MGNLPPGIFRICGKYRLRRKIGSGSFGASLQATMRVLILKGSFTSGDVYYADNIITGEEVAIKMESLKSDYSMLDHE
jgi:hypothetical protein